MMLHLAKTVFLQERMDWNRPHLNWVQSIYYSTRKQRR